jgi:hypothetical protein
VRGIGELNLLPAEGGDHPGEKAMVPFDVKGIVRAIHEIYELIIEREIGQLS